MVAAPQTDGCGGDPHRRRGRYIHGHPNSHGDPNPDVYTDAYSGGADGDSDSDPHPPDPEPGNSLELFARGRLGLGHA